MNSISERVINMMEERVHFERIYEIIRPEIKTKNKLYRLIDESIIPEYGDINVSMYFYDYFVECYNTTFVWGECSFYEFMAKNHLQMRQKYYSLEKCMRTAFSRVDENMTYVPKEVFSTIDLAIENNIPIKLDFKYAFKQKINKESFIERYLTTKYTVSQLKYYVQKTVAKISDKDMSVSEYIKLILDCRGEVAKRRMHTLVGLITKVTFYYSFKYQSTKFYRSLEKEGWLTSEQIELINLNRDDRVVEIIAKWRNATKEEIERALSEANKRFLFNRQKFSKGHILEVLYGIKKEVSIQRQKDAFDRSPMSEFINLKIQEYFRTEPEQLVLNNQESLIMGADKWIVYVHRKITITQNIFDFTTLPVSIKNDLQLYIKYKSADDYVLIIKLVNTLNITLIVMQL